MTADLSFKQACDILKADHKDQKLVDAVDNLLGLALIVAPTLAGLPPGAVEAGLGLLGVKNELTKNAKYLLDKIGKKKETSVARQRRMEAAHAIVCYASFFEAVDEALPGIWKTLGINPDDKQALLSAAKSAVQTKEKSKDRATLPSRDDLRTPLPHPAETFASHLEYVKKVYAELTKGLLSFLTCLKVVAPEAGKAVREIDAIAEDLPKRALDIYQAQYFDLAAKFEEFFIWANLQEHKGTGKLLMQMPSYIQAQVEVSKDSQKTIDVGFQSLAKAIQAIPEQIETRKAHTVLEELSNYYRDAISRPIIADDRTEGDPLIYPNIRDVFIPQSFKVIRYSGRERLEHENTWRTLKSRNDLGAFLLAYFTSPISTRLPLVLLGHPGSGKSLLTQMLAAVLNSDRLFTAIRVRLRDINADQGIPAQIREQILKDVGRETNWADLTDHMPQPALVLFDGYDELLQASGRVFAGYISQVQDFQHDEMATRKKPVRAVVTSRITWIDKAEIRPGTTILRLEDFDEAKRSEWISLWNRANEGYFSKAQVKPFALPKEDNNILPLASQPLLLLMLALYDSQGNALRKHERLDRTALYDALLRQFVEREKKKDPEYRQLQRKDQILEVDLEMERLGAAAIGMFNRRSLYIRSPELNADLTFFKLERDLPDGRGSRLSQAELLFGSFFFVHRSKTSHKQEAPDSKHEDIAFEFLHNTFGEFLTADFLLRRIREEVETVHELKQGQRSRKELEKKFSEASGLSEGWFAGLIHAALHSRPVVLEMMREWLPHNLTKTGRRIDEFLADLDLVVNNQLNRILTSNAFPPLITDKGQSHFVTLPLLGYTAIYSLNLVVLRTILSPSGFSFDEKAFQRSPDGCRAWDRLAYLWRAWFSMESLAGVSAVLRAQREETLIKVEAKEKFNAEPSHDTLETVLNIGMALADELTIGLAGFLAHDRGSAEVPIDVVGRYLDRNGIDVGLQIVARALRDMRLRTNRRSPFELRRGSPEGTEYFRNALRFSFRRSFRMRHRRLTGFGWEHREILIAAIETGNFRLIDEFFHHPEFSDQQLLFHDDLAGRNLATEVALEVLLRILIQEGDVPPYGDFPDRTAEAAYKIIRRLPFPGNVPPLLLKLADYVAEQTGSALAFAIRAGLSEAPRGKLSDEE